MYNVGIHVYDCYFAKTMFECASCWSSKSPLAIIKDDGSLVVSTCTIIPFLHEKETFFFFRWISAIYTSYTIGFLFSRQKKESTNSAVPLLQSPPDFVRRRPAAFQLKTMSGRAWDPDLLASRDNRWTTNGESNSK